MSDESRPKAGPGFETKYQDDDYAARYANKHRTSVGRIIADAFEMRMAERALRRVGRVESILDCPAGAGRFWPVLHRYANTLHVADASASMLAEAERRHPEIPVASRSVGRVQDLDLAARSFDLVFSNRLIHHLPMAKDRMEVLTALGRLTREWLLVSAWVEGNLAHRRRQRRETRHPDRPSGRVFLPLATLEEEILRTGFVRRLVVRKFSGISPLVMLVCQRRPS